MNTSLRLIICVLLSLGWAGSYGTTVFQAAEPDAPSPWRDALRLLDSSSQADVAAAENMLHASIAEGRVPPEALCTLALLQLRQDKPTEALATINDMQAQYDVAELQRTTALSLRIQLYAALATGQGRQADSAFKDLVRQIVSQSGDVIDLRYSAITIGVVTAMLDADLADSPIDPRDLKIGRDCMLQSDLFGIAGAFSSANQQASERTAELVRQFQLIAAKGIDVVAAENAARLAALDTSLTELAQQKELAAEIFRNAREQADQNTRDLRKLDKLINSIGVKLRQPTPGHPGTQRPPPPPPPPATTIPVNEYELRTVYEYVTQNGQTVGIPVTREVRRNQADIDYERNARYQRMSDTYQRVKADYDRYLTTYNQAMKSWNETDTARRQDLNEQKKAVEMQRAELLAESQRLKAEKSSAAGEVVRKRTARKQEEFELELQTIAIDAVRTQNIPAAFRPRNFPVISWSQEKTLLQRSTP